jgi:hypothetical protein
MVELTNDSGAVGIRQLTDGELDHVAGGDGGAAGDDAGGKGDKGGKHGGGGKGGKGGKKGGGAASDFAGFGGA